jgi:hypothetical protein
MTAYNQPTVAEFKAYFNRDFPYGSTPQSVMDSDITKAQGEALFNFNSDLFSSQDNYSICFNLLTAHFLVMDLRQSSQGIAGQFSWNATSKSVGSVSESIQIPDRIMQNPEFAYLTKTNYGTKYLMLLLPMLSGQVFTVEGSTRP